MRVVRWFCAALLAACVAAPAAAQQVTRYDATDFPGNDIDDIVGPTRSFDDCVRRCVGDGRCAAVTYNLDNGVCFPKSAGDAPQRNARATSGLVTRAQPPAYGGGGAHGITRYDATDFPGADLGDLVGRARSYDDCAQRCLADGRCNAFTFNLNDGTCIPKSSAAQAERNDRAVSGIVRGGRPGPGGPAYRPDAGLPVTRYDATDFPAFDIPDAVGQARSYEDCARRCLADGRCAGFTFNLNNGACIPKSAVVVPQRNERAVSGVLHRAPPDRVPPSQAGAVAPSGGMLTRYDQTDFPGNDIGGGPTRSFDECAQRCLADGRCGAFTYNLSNGTCIQKSAAGAPHRDDRAVSGVIDRAGGGYPNAAPGYPGGAVGAANACSVGGSGRCPGCSVSCPASQRPVCTAPLEGTAGTCMRDAWCRCSPN